MLRMFVKIAAKTIFANLMQLCFGKLNKTIDIL
jgi:hypothetical protein